MEPLIELLWSHGQLLGWQLLLRALLLRDLGCRLGAARGAPGLRFRTEALALRLHAMIQGSYSVTVTYLWAFKNFGGFGFRLRV